MAWIIESDVNVHHSEKAYMRGTLRPGDAVVMASAVPPPEPETLTVSWHPDVLQRAHDQLIAYRDWCYEEDRPSKPPFIFPSEAMAAIDALRACGVDSRLPEKGEPA